MTGQPHCSGPGDTAGSVSSAAAGEKIRIAETGRESCWLRPAPADTEATRAFSQPPEPSAS